MFGFILVPYFPNAVSSASQSSSSFVLEFVEDEDRFAEDEDDSIHAKSVCDRNGFSLAVRPRK